MTGVLPLSFHDGGDVLGLHVGHEPVTVLGDERLKGVAIAALTARRQVSPFAGVAIEINKGGDGARLGLALDRRGFGL